MSAKESPLGFNTISLARESTSWTRDGSGEENLNITNDTTEDAVEEELTSPPTNYSYYHSFLSTPVKDEQQKSPFSYPGYQADQSQPGSRESVPKSNLEQERQLDCGDRFISVRVCSPRRVEKGRLSYVTYTVKTQTNLEFFTRKKPTVSRRFSDFIGLRDKLCSQYLQHGSIIPSLPDKSVIGMAKVKFSKMLDLSYSELVELRRVSLERFLTRIAEHPNLRLDPHFREFLELDVILPISRGTQSLSGNNIWRMMNAWNDGIKTVYTVRMLETDQWFVEKTEQIMKIESQLLKLQEIAEDMVEQKKNLARHNRSLSKNLVTLSKVEDNKKMAGLYVDVANVEDRVGGLQEEQVNIDLLLISATFRDYIGMIGSVKETLGVRKNAWHRWQEVLRDVDRKEEVMRKAELEGKQEIVRKLGLEIIEKELQRDLAQNVFDNLSRNFKEEYETFEVKNFYHFKKSILDYSDKMQNSATNIGSYWEGLLPKIEENDFK